MSIPLGFVSLGTRGKRRKGGNKTISQSRQAYCDSFGLQTQRSMCLLPQNVLRRAWPGSQGQVTLKKNTHFNKPYPHRITTILTTLLRAHSLPEPEREKLPPLQACFYSFPNSNQKVILGAGGWEVWTEAERYLLNWPAKKDTRWKKKS